MQREICNLGILKFNEFDFTDSDYKSQSFQIAFQNLMLLFMKTYFLFVHRYVIGVYAKAMLRELLQQIIICFRY